MATMTPIASWAFPKTPRATSLPPRLVCCFRAAEAGAHLCYCLGRYDDIMDAYIRLSEQYQSDPARLKADPLCPGPLRMARVAVKYPRLCVQKIEAAKEFIMNERLKARMAGAMRPTGATR